MIFDLDEVIRYLLLLLFLFLFLVYTIVFLAYVFDEFYDCFIVIVINAVFYLLFMSEGIVVLEKGLK